LGFSKYPKIQQEYNYLGQLFRYRNLDKEKMKRLSISKQYWLLSVTAKNILLN
jgi:hypothetical protein